MPSKPTVKRKPWTEKRVQHQRVKDMRWFYNSRKWRKFSRDYKNKNPFCVQCEADGIVKQSEVTDHIETYEVCPDGFDLDKLEEKYMQPLCKKCHDRKSGKEAYKK